MAISAFYLRYLLIFGPAICGQILNITGTQTKISLFCENRENGFLGVLLVLRPVLGKILRNGWSSNELGQTMDKNR